MSGSDFFTYFILAVQIYPSYTKWQKFCGGRRILISRYVLAEITAKHRI